MLSDVYSGFYDELVADSNAAAMREMKKRRSSDYKKIQLQQTWASKECLRQVRKMIQSEPDSPLFGMSITITGNDGSSRTVRADTIGDIKLDDTDEGISFSPIEMPEPEPTTSSGDPTTSSESPPPPPPQHDVCDAVEDDDATSTRHEEDDGMVPLECNYFFIQINGLITRCSKTRTHYNLW